MNKNVSVVKKVQNNTINAPSGLFKTIFLKVSEFFLFVFIFGLLLIIMDSATGNQYRLIPNVTLADTVSGLWLGLIATLGAVLDFLSELIFHLRFRPDGLMLVMIKWASWIGFTISTVIFDVFSLPFRLLTSLIGEHWIGYKLVGLCDYGCKADQVPSYTNFTKGNTVVTYLGLDTNGAFDFGFVYHTVGTKLPEIKLGPFGHIGGDYVGNENVRFMGTIALAKVKRSTSDGIVTIYPFGFNLDIFFTSLINSETSKSLYSFFSDYLGKINTGLGSWQDIINELLSKQYKLP